MGIGAETREKPGAGETMRLVRPQALLLTAAAPQREGSDARRQAWRLLDLAYRTHDVHLVVHADGPVHYDHWCELSRTARQVTLVPRRPLRPAARGVASAVADETANQMFDAVLCSDVRLWRALSAVPARVRFCDGRHEWAALAQVLAPPARVADAAPRPMTLRRAA